MFSLHLPQSIEIYTTYSGIFYYLSFVPQTCFRILVKTQHKLVITKSLLLIPLKCILWQRGIFILRIQFISISLADRAKMKASEDRDVRQSCEVFAAKILSLRLASSPPALCSTGYFHSKLLRICRFKWIRFHCKNNLGSWKCHRCVRHIPISGVSHHVAN